MSRPNPSVAFVSLGCRVNRVETDAILAELEARGVAVADEREAQAVVINTCAVTGEAEAKTRKAIRHAASLPQRPVVIATGCVASLFSSELSALGDNVVVEPEKSRVAQRVLDELEAGGGLCPDGLPSPQGLGHVTPSGRTRPGIKIQDGCDLRCSYCIVWKARGSSRSVDVEEVVRLVRGACEQGAREVMLTGINLGRYQGLLDGREVGLAQLLDLLLERTEVGRLRLGSIEPQDVDARLADVMAASEGRVAPFLHMCLQSGSDATLGRMRRVYGTRDFAARADLARSKVPGLMLGTDLIVGFPGEDDAEFEESLAFCEQMRFSRMHVFRYSRRAGTPAATMPNQVSPLVMAARAKAVHTAADRMRHEEALSLVGTGDLVIAQGARTGVSGGLYDVVLSADVEPDGLYRVRVDAVDERSRLLATPLAPA